jgi:hypothetical protein
MSSSISAISGMSNNSLNPNLINPSDSTQQILDPKEQETLTSELNQQPTNLQDMQFLITDLRVEFYKLLSIAKAHPKNLALWMDILAVKSKAMTLEKYVKEGAQNPQLDTKSISNHLSMLDKASSSAISTARSLSHQEFSNQTANKNGHVSGGPPEIHTKSQLDDYLCMLDASSSPAISNAESLGNKDFTNIHLKEAQSSGRSNISLEDSIKNTVITSTAA